MPSRRDWLRHAGCACAAPALACGLQACGLPDALRVDAPLASRPLGADGSVSGGIALREADLEPRTIVRVSVGSCANQTLPQPVWRAILDDQPGLHLFAGDNVYASTQPWQAEAARAAYAALAAQTGFARLRERVAHLAIWDDHDYGLNDGGADFAQQDASKAEFLRFWRVDAADERRGRAGLYHARRFGLPGETLQVLMLDTRSFRSPWQPTDRPGAPGRQRYLPSSDAGRTMLGAAQWRWLERQLSEPADLRLIVSGIQVIAEGHGYEHWGLFPHEQQRLIDLIRRSRAQGVVLLSGDRHIGAVYRRTEGVPYPLHELTSSGLTHAWAEASEPGPNRLGDLVRVNHYALVEIGWRQRAALITLKDERGQPLQQHLIPLDTLKAP
jgi:alkaline phosphatase D